MRPGKLYSRDYTVLTSEEKKEKEAYFINNSSLSTLKPIDYYPLAVRHNLSLFPNITLS